MNSKYTTTETFWTPTNFNYFPAVLLLQNNDTVRGRFTKAGSALLQINANNDSNYKIEKSTNWAIRSHYYYKKFEADSLKAYVVKGQRYEPVVITKKKTDSSYVPPKGYRQFMKRLTADGSPLQLYRDLNPILKEQDKVSFIGVVLDILSYHYDTTIGGTDYNFVYYLHFPDEHPLLVWNLDYGSATKRLKETIVESANDCPGLAETAQQLQHTDKHRDILRSLVRSDTAIKTTGLRALIDRLEIYNDCYKRKLH